MKFWTIQNKRVIEIINKEGIYKPDFSYSGYLEEIEELRDLYSLILKAFNDINDSDLSGVVFSFAKCEDNWIKPIETIVEFKEFIKSKHAVIASYWNHIDKANSVLIELEFEEDFNPIFIDINDFQFLMPPIMLMYPYTEESINRIIRSIMTGRITVSEFPSNVIQAHLPYIEKKNVVNIYPLFEI